MASDKAGTGVWTCAGKNIETQGASAAATNGWGCPPIDPEGVTASDMAVTQTWTCLDNSLN
ncbi:MAG: hypothetical protein CMM46_14990 [Rhodospirillaceae bacterium]|nr:hypothetical protein [Rhodospirillaceae bacterium]|tara:strand:- start:1131 stop:1313 length:183 start_codon:yes stop_codon:yes gene_type:complete